MSTQLSILKQASVDTLHEQIAHNISFYESANPDWEAVLGADYKRETSVKINGSIDELFSSEDYSAMKTKEDVLENEVNRCIAIYNALKNLTPQQATDERVWTYLTHFVFWDYTRARWAPFPKDKKKKANSIKSHFFLPNARSMVRDNAISRLWWMAHICSCVKTCALKDALEALLHKEDVRKEIMERATFCRSEPILNSLMKYLVESYNSNSKELHDRDTFRELSKQLNRIGGKIVLDSLSQKQLDALVGDAINRIIANK